MIYKAPAKESAWVVVNLNFYMNLPISNDTILNMSWAHSENDCRQIIISDEWIYVKQKAHLQSPPQALVLRVALSKMFITNKVLMAGRRADAGCREHHYTECWNLYQKDLDRQYLWTWFNKEKFNREALLFRHLPLTPNRKKIQMPPKFYPNNKITG